MDIFETFANISRDLSNRLIEKSSDYVSITPSSIISKLILVFVSLGLIYLASIITKRSVKILLYIVGGLLIVLLGVNLVQNI